jgi:PIN domain nuclease of toxin-antitoxin system
VDLDVSTTRAEIRPARPPVTLLDTNAIIWLHLGHPRSRPLQRHPGRLSISPASVLELQYLTEAGKLALRGGVMDLAHDPAWVLDDPPSADWFEEATDVTWTRDPFDRLLVAHARVRGWRLATGDRLLLDRLGTRQSIAL